MASAYSFPATAGGRLSTPCGCGLPHHDRAIDQPVGTHTKSDIGGTAHLADIAVGDLAALADRQEGHAVRFHLIDGIRRTTTGLADVISGAENLRHRQIESATRKVATAGDQFLFGTVHRGGHRSLARGGRALDNRLGCGGDHGGGGLDHRGDHRLGLLRLLLNSHGVGS